MQPEDPRPTPEDLAASIERLMLVRYALTQLSERHLQLVVLRYEHDYTFEQIAARTGRKKSAVIRMHGRVIVRLARELRKVGITRLADL